MITLFAICAVIGVLSLILEQGAKYSSVAPSMYRTSGDGWLLILIGVIGMLCVGLLP